MNQKELIELINAYKNAKNELEKLESKLEKEIRVGWGVEGLFKCNKCGKIHSEKLQYFKRGVMEYAMCPQCVLAELIEGNKK